MQNNLWTNKKLKVWNQKNRGIINREGITVIKIKLSQTIANIILGHTFYEWGAEAVRNWAIYGRVSVYLIPYAKKKRSYEKEKFICSNIRNHLPMLSQALIRKRKKNIALRVGRRILADEKLLKYLQTL